ncbi:hypothetical protein DASC09_050590 [Saccharomycopsis crataegensis]|uniref:Uncharacterized protein n=1 Tax=Saccharomycopsis crataegensis TaxID=43959 RepID=A0AAV5QSL9_9ASCO|nr:hypothetical protein DASC09_050590 [Saccharomycopsis crataegensis]
MLTWFITGTSSGLGAAFAEAALTKGDKVIAASRDSNRLTYLKSKGAIVVDFDVNASADTVKSSLSTIDKKYGPIDVVVNNAGYGELGAVEEVGLDLVEKQYSANVFGPIKVIQGILPEFRKRRNGLIINIASRVGHESLPFFGYYSSTKSSLMTLSTTLDLEVKKFGIRSIAIETGAFRTDFFKDSRKEENKITLQGTIKDYDEERDVASAGYETFSSNIIGDPKALASQIVALAHHEGPYEKEIPPVISFGKDTYEVIQRYAKDALERLEKWKEVTFSTDKYDW